MRRGMSQIIFAYQYLVNCSQNTESNYYT